MSAAVAAAQVATTTDPNRLSQVSTHSYNSATRKSKTHIGPWRLGRTLGRGSSGRVRLAKHTTTGQLAAVKIVPKSVIATDGDSTNTKGLPYGIEREVIIMKLIEHPNVMALYDVWENKGELYLVLEYIEGGELFDYLIRKGRLEEREAVNYFRQIIYGVDYCHKFNICHRDLKPENLLLDKHRNIKIADFGMAALETSDRMLETSCGSPHYASPEIVAGKNYHGAPSDIWSCGIILFALLTGHLPFDDENIRRLLMKVQSGKYKMPESLSIEAKDLINSMLQINPDNRIKMRDILNHPLLRKYPQRRLVAEQQRRIANSGTKDVFRPIDRVQDIDMEILKNLQTLWHGEDKSKIAERLLSPEPNTEKTFYCLLVKYRHDHRHDSTHSSQQNPALNSSHHRKRSSQSIALNSAQHRRRSSQSITTRAHGRKNSGHARTGSRSSVITASSSHKHNVSFSAVQPKTKKSNNPVTKVQQYHQQPSPPTEPATATVTINTAPEPQHQSSIRIRKREVPPQEFSFVPAPEPRERQQHSQQQTGIPVAEEAPRPRITSAPNPSNSSPRQIEAAPDRRAFSLGSERRASIFDPGSRPFSVVSTYSTVSTADSTTTQSSAAPVTPDLAVAPYLPRIFEEERFADAIEEEVNERTYSAGPRQPQVKAAQDFDLFNERQDTDQDFFKALKLPELPPVRRTASPAQEPSRLQISGLIKTDSFKTRTRHSQVPAPAPAQAQAQTPAMTTRSPPQIATSFAPFSANETPSLAHGHQSNGGGTNVYSHRQSASPPLGDSGPQAGTPRPVSMKRRPLGAKDTNLRLPNEKPVMITSNGSYVIDRSLEDGKGSLFRRLTRRQPPSPGLNETKGFEQVPRNPPSPNPQSVVEPKQNWLMKMLSSNTEKMKTEESRTIYSTLPLNRLRIAILDVLHEWKKYGITNITEDPYSATIRATISSRNVLKARSSKFRVQIDTVRAVSAATFVKEKGSDSTFKRFLGEIETALNDFTDTYQRRKQRAQYHYEQELLEKEHVQHRAKQYTRALY